MALSPDTPDWEHDLMLDAGELGCGELIMRMKEVIQPLASGTRVLVVARDYGAAPELGAWCHMTGNRLVRDDREYFLIIRQRKED